MDKDKNKTKEEGDKIEFGKQVENYDTLNIFQSSRGQVVLVFAGLLLLTFILSFFEIANLTDLLWSLVVYIPILFFVYEGHRWAMISLMVLWVIEKGYTAYTAIESGGSVIGSLIWLFIGLSVIYKALKVENERKKINININKKDGSVSNGRFCTHCGKAIEIDSKFCIHCGKDINSTL